MAIERSQAAPEPWLRVERVVRRYRRLAAVNGLSLEVRRGETFGLLGPNGAGKSTLLRMLAGADHPDAGEISLAGESVKRTTTRARIGIAPQDLALYGNLSAEENLRFAGRLYGLSGKHLAERVAATLEVSGLVARRHDRVRGFSGGMQRRLNLACAIVHEPQLILLDEPTAGVDPQSRNHIFDALERIRATGITVVYSTHYMEEAERLCDRIAIVDGGRLLALGTLNELTRAHGTGHRLAIELDGDLPEGLPAPSFREGATFVFTTSEPWQLVERLAAVGARIRSLHVEKPSLEGVFLALTGRSLRD
jgi:ABC-2 type transport system ATP-binding protein